MGTSPQEKNKRSTKNGQGAAGSAAAKIPFVFRPTEAQKEAIKANWMDAEKCIAVVEEQLEAECKLIIGHATSTGAMYATLRANYPDLAWDQQPAVTCWHRDAAMTLVMLAYYLREVNPAFPEAIQGTFRDQDWNW